MNFGDRVKQLRIQKNLTQPQLAQAIGIEQSYLSKLENDKSVPGTEIFQAILRAFNMDVGSFLEGVDDQVVHRELRQVPEVANHLNSKVALRIHDSRKWLFSSAIAGVLGLTLLVAGYKQLLFSDWQYTYESAGVVHPGEPSNVFDNPESWLFNKMEAKEIDSTEMHKRIAEIQARRSSNFLTLREQRGDAFIEQVPGGSRAYRRGNSIYQPSAENRLLELVGCLLAFSSLFGFIVEMRLRQLKRP